MDMFRAQGELVEPQGDMPTLPDPDDSMFLHCALAAGAEYLVTGNRRDFPQDACRPVRVLNAAELLDHLTLDIGPAMQRRHLLGN